MLACRMSDNRLNQYTSPSLVIGKTFEMRPQRCGFLKDKPLMGKKALSHPSIWKLLCGYMRMHGMVIA